MSAQIFIPTFRLANNKLSEAWASISYLLRISEKINETISISKYIVNQGDLEDISIKIEEIIPILNSKGKLVIDEDTGEVQINIKQAFSKSYLPTNIKWKASDSNKVAYQFDSTRRIANNNLSKEEEKTIISELTNRGYNPIRLGRYLSLQQCVEELSTSKFFVGVSSGMSHVAHSVGTPMYLIKNKIKRAEFKERHLGNQDYIKCVDAIDFLELSLKSATFDGNATNI